jgi:hypothetical protein
MTLTSAPHRHSRESGNPGRKDAVSNQTDVPAPVHAGEGRYPRQPWVSACAGMDENLISTRHYCWCLLKKLSKSTELTLRTTPLSLPRKRESRAAEWVG